MNKNRLALTLALSLLPPAAHAAERVPGTWTYYSVSRDPITDVNTSMILIDEINDLTSQTYLGFRCSNEDYAHTWAMLSTKNPLYDPETLWMPEATIRIGQNPPVTVPADAITAVGNSYSSDETTIGFPEGITRQMAAGLFAGQSVVVRLSRDPSVGRQVLTFTFPANGFKTAWNAVGRCQSSGAPASAPVSQTRSSAAPSAGNRTEAPKFTEWYFTTCTDTASGAVRSQLRAGQTHRCQLVINTVPNGAVPVAATFTYELEYVEAGRSGKLTLDTRDRWQAGGSGPILFRTEGGRLIFNLPLNVRARAERRYTSINVTGEVVFSNGSSKRVYEKLPVAL